MRAARKPAFILHKVTGPLRPAEPKTERGCVVADGISFTEVTHRLRPTHSVPPHHVPVSCSACLRSRYWRRATRTSAARVRSFGAGGPDILSRRAGGSLTIVGPFGCRSLGCGRLPRALAQGNASWRRG